MNCENNHQTKKTLQLISYVVFYALMLVLSVFCIFCIINVVKENASLLLYLVIGVVLTFILSIILHETGHIFFAAIYGQRVVMIQVLWFKFEMTKTGKKFFLANSGGVFGSTVTVPKYEGKAKKGLFYSLIGGVIFSLLYLTFSLLILFGAFNFGKEFFLIFGATSIIPFYVCFNNMLPSTAFGGGNDGGMILGLIFDTPKSRVLVNLSEIEGELFRGKLYSEIAEKYFTDNPQLCEDEYFFALLLFYSYKRNLDLDQMKLAKQEHNRLQEILCYLPDYLYYKVRAEIVYGNICLFGNEVGENKDIKETLQKQNTAESRRALAAYSKYVEKDSVKAGEYKSAAIESLEKQPLKAVFELETKLIERI